jgi:hypothetical protein
MTEDDSDFAHPDGKVRPNYLTKGPFGIVHSLFAWPIQS